MKMYKKLILILIGFIACSSFVIASEEVMKVYSELNVLYSFTDSIEYISLSQNGERMIILTEGKKTKKHSVYVAYSNGIGLKEVFSSGVYDLGEEVYLDIVQTLPYISGDGSKIILGLRATKSISAKNDYFMVYDVKSGKRIFFPLKNLVKGSSYVRFPRANLNNFPFYSTDFNAKKIVTQVEVGIESSVCSAYDYAIVIINIDGSNQRMLVGPEAVIGDCSFKWSNYPKSPHYPTLSYDGGKVIFYGKVFISEDPIDRTGELFAINSDGSNLRQLTSSKRFDRKIESLGPFLLNFYGTRVYFKSFYNNSFKISSISVNGGEIQNHVSISENSPYFISGDGRRLFFISEEHKESLVYYDIMKESINIVLDFTFSGKPYNYGTIKSLDLKNISTTNLTDFAGSFLLVRNKSDENDWVYKISIDEKLLSRQEISLEFKIGSSIAKVGERLISLDVSPYIKKGRAMVPLSLTGNTFNAKVIWYNNIRACYVRFNGNLLILYLDKDICWFNGQTKKIDVAPEMKASEFFVPAKILKDFMFLDIKWDSKTQSLLISRKAKNG
jgi:hypothetical protein